MRVRKSVNREIIEYRESKAEALKAPSTESDYTFCQSLNIFLICVSFFFWSKKNPTCSFCEGTFSFL